MGVATEENCLGNFKTSPMNDMRIMSYFISRCSLVHPSKHPQWMRSIFDCCYRGFIMVSSYLRTFILTINPNGNRSVSVRSYWIETFWVKAVPPTLQTSWTAIFRERLLFVKQTMYVVAFIAMQGPLFDVLRRMEKRHVPQRSLTRKL